MRSFITLTGLAIFCSSVALAAPAPAPIAAAKFENRASACTFSGSNGAALASKSKTSCSTIVLSNVAVPAGTTLDLTGLNEGTKVIFEGTTTFGYKEWAGPLVSVSGSDVTVEGAPGAVLNGDGARWWDGKGSNGGKKKPKFFFAHNLKSSNISNIKIENSPVQVFSINGAETLILDSITIDNSVGDSTGAHNTDAFDVGDSNGVTISNANVQNQDDCLAINSGTNIIFTGGTCSGGHGLSIGSVGGRSDNTVKTVHIENSTIKNSQNGVRIKTVSGATGSVSGVTYKDITLSGITKYGIVIEQDYENGSPTGKPTSGVPITGLAIDGVTGSVSNSATGVYILCGKGSCSNWTWEGVKITGGKKSSKCENIPSAASC
ncbi:polygalacturonase 2 precursor, putative [Talaromyces stipitatus ATCC 10500]|uniref:endo-polygalacturonase n=1 Tax=Talaromyces stipitatus (strain ATCC 10500 / CBS 375.48 / QM 6759 / NRRL 1006) TaxID=441959 RepID=B8MS03_TALSN|nr:polygalacturonase 2 precursor, putative [Talaromyces stipitatus ATCC 10500]EED12048.1 polygalacturonase 2 precursor, putative [Talaromyces stipitatus ATCC 10500]